LRNCWTLDSAANTHVCNDRSRFKFKRIAGEEDTLYAGKDSYEIEAFGTVDLTVQTPNGIAKIILLNVALVPGFLTNLVSLRRFIDKGIHWDTEKGHLHRKGKVFCYVEPYEDHWVLEKHPISFSFAFATSPGPRPVKEASTSTWHVILGHLSAETISHLEQATTDTKLAGSAIDIANCVPCRLSKAREIVSRRIIKKDPADEPLARVAYDLMNFEKGYNGDCWVCHFKCCLTTIDFVYTYSKKSQTVDVITEFVNMIYNRYNRRIRYFRTDGERALEYEFDDLIASLRISIERLVTATSA
jgi:hypothetical protein